MPVMVMTLLGACVLTVITYTFVGAALGMHPLELSVVVFIATVTLLYIAALTVARNIYIKHCDSLL